MRHASARVLRALLAALTALVATSLLSCHQTHSITGGGGASGTTTVIIQVRTSAQLEGLSVDVGFPGTLSVTQATAVGPLAGTSCAPNIQAGRFRGACVTSAPFSVPATIWSLEVAGDASGGVAGSMTILSCQGSDATGTTIALDCALSG